MNEAEPDSHWHLLANEVGKEVGDLCLRHVSEAAHIDAARVARLLRCTTHIRSKAFGSREGDGAVGIARRLYVPSVVSWGAAAFGLSYARRTTGTTLQLRMCWRGLSPRWPPWAAYAGAGWARLTRGWAARDVAVAAVVVAPVVAPIVVAPIVAAVVVATVIVRAAVHCDSSWETEIEFLVCQAVQSHCWVIAWV